MTAPLERRQQVIDARAAYYRREITEEQLHKVVDEYLDAIVAWQKAHGRRVRRPSRGYVLRAL